ncbi:hypothetical protein YQE_00333, partial [Dendroctonus ponderosae]
MFNNFSERDLAMVALCLDNEEEEKQRYLREIKRKRRFWVHAAWKTRPHEGEFFSLFPHLLDDEMKFYQFLATGDSFKTISFSYRMGRSTVCTIVHHTSKAVIEVLLNEVMPVPDEVKWSEIATTFWERWQFPNCIGALDGKHVTIQAPKLSGSLYWNYKKTYSI